MSEAQVVNMMLHRKLESGSQYSRLIPNYLSVKHSFELPTEFSDTYDTLEYMAYWTDEYAHQFEKVAQVLIGKNVLETVENNYNFLYKHFQYKIDENLQQIYAPSAAWHFRKVGFDCKTFSVLAMALLLCQNIEASFVKVKLLGSIDWSHVYVQIPYQGSYLIIDATTHDNKEVDFIEKHEFNMKNLKHIGLASPFMDTPYLNLDSPSLACPGQACSCNSTGLSSSYMDASDPYGVVYMGSNGLGNPEDTNSDSTTTTTNSTDWGNFFKDLKFDKIFASIDCWGGTAFDANILQALIPEIQKYFIGIINEYNTAILEKRFSDVHKILMKFVQRKQTLLKVYHVKFESKDWNSCSDASFYFVFDFLNNKIGDILYKSLKAHLETYFQVGTDRNNTIQFTQPANMPDTFDGVYMWGTLVSIPVSEMTVRSWDENPKPFAYSVNVTPKQETIPAFILTAQTTAALNSDVANTQLNLSDVLQTIAATAPIIFPLITGDTQNGGSGVYYPDDSYPPKPPTTKTSGVGTLALATAGTAGLIFAFSKMKDEGPGAKKTISKSKKK